MRISSTPLPARDARAERLPARLPARLWACLIATCLAATAAAQPANGPIAEKIQRATIGEAVVGVAALDLETGRPIALIGEAAAMVPASNQKLLTTGAALLTLGPSFVYQTAVKVEGDRVRIVGAGDPSLGDAELLEQTQPDLSTEGLLAALANAVLEADTGPIREVVVDDRVFDRQHLHPSWDPDDVNKSWSAEVSGLAFNANVLAVFVEPGAGGAGSAPKYHVEPAVPWIEMQNRGRTVTKSRHTAWISRSLANNRFTILGNIRYAAQVPIRVPFHDAPTFIAELFADRLARAGVRTADGGTPPSRAAEPNERFEAGRTVAVVNTPLADVLRQCNVDSQNLYAESLLKLIGHRVTGEPGSWTNGGAVVRMLISDTIGAEHAATTAVADGSGLSDQNRVSPLTLARWLRALYERDPLRTPMVESMPTVGEGTLKRRFRSTALQNDVRAKSGTIDGVRCLSGYLLDGTGGGIAFSILVNDLKAGEQSINALRLHEAIVAELDVYLSETSPARESKVGG